MLPKTPFSETIELSNELNWDIRSTPLSLTRTESKFSTLPGQPRTNLDPMGLRLYLEKELFTKDLDRLEPLLWLVSTPRSSHISPLHHQVVRKRRIVLTESPKLHLLWQGDQIFIKPIPRYMLSCAFWQYLLNESEELGKAAIGFMRTYSHLVKYESDFCLGQTIGLIPQDSISLNCQDGVKITWESFAALISCFDRYYDKDVSPRYSYGELRLTRVNFWARIRLRKLTYYHVPSQWGDYLHAMLSPLIAISVVLFIILNAMQVELAAQQDSSEGQWKAFTRASMYFSVVVLILTAFFMAVLIGWFLYMAVHEFNFSRAILAKRRRGMLESDWEGIKSQIV